MKFKARIVAIIITVVAVSVGCYLVLSKPETIEDVSRRALSCLANEDAGCLSSLVMDSELKSYGIDKSKFKGLLKEYVFPSLKKVSQSDVTCATLPSSDNVFCALEVTLVNGSKMTIEVDATQTSEGIKCPLMICNLLLTCSVARFPQSSNSPAGIAKLQAWRDQAVKDKELLQGLGFRGVLRDEHEGLVLWDRWETMCTERVEDRLNKLKGSK